MELIKGHSTAPKEPTTDARYQFPAVEEPWEVACGGDRFEDTELPTSKCRDREGIGRWELDVTN